MGAVKEATGTKASKVKAKQEETPVVIESNGLRLTLDNSLKKFANDKFFIDQAKAVNEKLKNRKLPL